MLYITQVSNIEDNLFNPRDYEDKKQKKDLEKLVQSVKEDGQIIPPMLYAVKGKKGIYAPIDGHRRIQACRIAGLKEIEFVWTKDKRFPKMPAEMTHEEGIVWIIRLGNKAVAHQAKDRIVAYNKLHEHGVRIPVEKYDKALYEIYENAPQWLKPLMAKRMSHSGRNEPRDGIGWTIVRDILNYTHGEEGPTRELVNLYLCRGIRDQRALSRYIQALRRGEMPSLRA